MEKALCVLADNVLDDVIDFACRLAKHRGSKALSRHDIRVAFEKRFKVKVATKAASTQNQTQSAAITQTHSAGAARPAAQAMLAPPISSASTDNYRRKLALVRKEQDAAAAASSSFAPSGQGL